MAGVTGPAEWRDAPREPLPALSDRRDGMTQADRPAVDAAGFSAVHQNIPRVGLLLPLQAQIFVNLNHSCRIGPSNSRRSIRTAPTMPPSGLGVGGALQEAQDYDVTIFT